MFRPGDLSFDHHGRCLPTKLSIKPFSGMLLSMMMMMVTRIDRNGLRVLDNYVVVDRANGHKPGHCTSLRLIDHQMDVREQNRVYRAICKKEIAWFFIDRVPLGHSVGVFA